MNFDLQWLEEKATELRRYVDDNPIEQLEDRTDLRQTQNGGVTTVVVSTIEKQIKSIRDTLKDYASIIEAIGKLREKEIEELSGNRSETEQSSLIAFELGWLEVQVDMLKAYVDYHPVDKLVDRKVTKQTTRGSSYEVSSATIEDQIRCIRETLKDKILLAETINKLYSKEKARRNMRGGSQLNFLQEEEM